MVVRETVDDAEYSGGLINLLQEGVAFVMRNSHKAWRKTADGRIEMPDYVERPVFEGIVNALIHRSYLELGSKIGCDKETDRACPEIFEEQWPH